eukprot:TRINITY_DN4625_c3_g1_i1.p1 TRINITY_DN4625_c3_g1~~TRINITY_DN4625_c3_g1_i1.p1  ORF type:complete len:1343 (+),score=458.07 TRINITY_DN4625_c3_g1_i1:55-4029(+)
MSAVAASAPAGAAPVATPARKQICDIDFGSAVAAQLQHQVATLNKTTYSTNVMEIERLLNRFGEDAYKMLLSLLVRDVVTSLGTSQSTVAQSPEALKMKLLSQELLKLPKFPNFISIASGLISAKELDGKGLQELVKGGQSWPLPVQLALGLAFAHSHDTVLQEDGFAFLKNKLSECVLPNVVKTLPECLVHHLLYCIQSTEVFTKQAMMLMQLETLRYSLLGLDPLNHSPKDAQATIKKRVEEQARLPAMCEEELSLAGVMQELGPGCTASPEMFGSVVEVLPRITSRTVGRAVVLMAMTQGTQVEPSNTQLECQQAFFDSMLAVGATQGTHEASKAKTWNVTNFVQVIKEHVTEGGAFWHKVIRDMDFPGLKLSTRGLTLIVSVLKAGTGEGELPIEHLLGEWENAESQLSVLSATLQAPPDLVSFATPRKIQWEGGPAAWASVDFVETLLIISASNRREQVELLFAPEKGNGPFQKTPDLLLLSLLSARPQQNELRRDLLSRILTQMLLKPSKSSAEVLSRAAKELLGPLCHSLSEAFITTPTLAEKIFLAASEGKWIEDFLGHCTSARLLSLIALLSAKRGGGEERVAGTQWLKGVLEGQIKVVPHLATLTRTLIASVELSPIEYPATEILHILAEESTPGLSPQQKQHARTLATDRANAVQQAQSPTPTPAAAPVAAAGGSGFPAVIEEEANKMLMLVFRHQIDPNTFIQSLNTLKGNPPATPQHQVYLCIVQMVFDEFHHLEKFPDKELHLMCELVGGLIAQNMLVPARLGKAMKFLIQNLHKPQHRSFQEFAVQAVRKFMHRIPEWPQYRTLLQRVPNIEGLVEGIGQYLNPQATPQVAAPQVAQPPPLSVPEVKQKVKDILSQVDASNLDKCTKALRTLLIPEVVGSCNEFLVRKAAMDPANHALYANLVAGLRHRELQNHCIRSTIALVKTIVASEELKTSSTLRGQLMCLGNWLGLVTLARTKPLMSRDLDIKTMLYEGLARGTLLYVLPFVTRFLKHAGSSNVFRPPNPWLLGMLGLLVDIHQLSDGKLVKQEVEALCHTLGLNVTDLVDTQGVRTKQRERLEELRQGSKKVVPAEPGGATPTVPATDAGAVPPPVGEGQDTPKLPTLRVPPHLPPTLLHLKEDLSVIMDKFANEVIISSMDRNCTIACAATKDLVIKDYATEPDDGKLLKAAHQMVTALASHLAMVTCKETLRSKMGEMLKQVIRKDETKLEEGSVERVVVDNVDACVATIEKAAAERATTQVDQLLKDHLEERKEYRATNPEVFELLPKDQNVEFLRSLPEPLRPKSGVLQTLDSVYEDFSRMRARTPASQ